MNTRIAIDNGNGLSSASGRENGDVLPTSSPPLPSVEDQSKMQKPNGRRRSNSDIPQAFFEQGVAVPRQQTSGAQYGYPGGPPPHPGPSSTPFPPSTDHSNGQKPNSRHSRRSNSDIPPAFFGMGEPVLYQQQNGVHYGYAGGPLPHPPPQYHHPAYYGYPQTAYSHTSYQVPPSASDADSLSTTQAVNYQQSYRPSFDRVYSDRSMMPQFSHHHLPHHTSLLPLGVRGGEPVILEHADYQQVYDPKETNGLLHNSPQISGVYTSSPGGHQPMNNQEKRNRRPKRNPRLRSHSSNAAIAPNQYGSFWNEATTNVATGEVIGTVQEGIPESYQSSRIHPSSNSSLGRTSRLGAELKSEGLPPINKQRFSPRNELRKMFQELSPQTSQRKMSTNTVQGAPGMTVASASPRVAWSPQIGATMLGPNASGMPPNSPAIRLASPAIGGRDSNTYLVGKPSRESSRKKQIRQQSAQRFMADIKGVEQPLRCRNVAFLLLFVFHLLFVGVYLGEKFAKDAILIHGEAAKPETLAIYYDKILFIAMLSGAFAIVTSTLLLEAMAIFARNFLKIALIIIITLSFIWGTIGVGLSPKTVVPVTGIIALGLAVGYTFIVWDRLPFATANLLSGLSGIKAFPSTVVVAVIMQIITWGWCMDFLIVAAGIYNAITHEKTELSESAIVACYILLGFSFYWTYQVIHGCMKAITAAIISGWWHTPDYPSLVRDSCLKTLFYSTGSICFGGLLIGPVTIFRQLSVLVRPSHGEPSLLCIHECIHFFQTWITYAVDYLTVRCNAYSFTYVGMYHYGFLEAGVNASELFAKRGWTVIVSDDLVPNVLFLTSLVMGGVTGCFAHIVATTNDLSITSLDGHEGSVFLLGTIVGFVLNSIVFSIVNSAMNTVLVCFASSPVDFERNHPDLSAEMREAWREVWPGALDIQGHHHLMLEEGIPLV